MDMRAFLPSCTNDETFSCDHKMFEKLEVNVPVREGTTGWKLHHIKIRGRNGG